MNPLEFELVVSVVVVAVVLDLVSIPNARVLVVVLVHLVSPVVVVLDEIDVVVDPFVIAVSRVATRTVVAHVVFAAETLSVAAVVPVSAVWVTPCLKRSSGSSPPILISITRISRSAGDAIRSSSFIRQLVRHCLKISHLSQIPMIVFHLLHLLTMGF